MFAFGQQGFELSTRPWRIVSRRATIPVGSFCWRLCVDLWASACWEATLGQMNGRFSLTESAHESGRVEVEADLQDRSISVWLRENNLYGNLFKVAGVSSLARLPPSQPSNLPDGSSILGSVVG